MFRIPFLTASLATLLWSSAIADGGGHGHGGGGHGGGGHGGGGHGGGGRPSGGGHASFAGRPAGVSSAPRVTGASFHPAVISPGVVHANHIAPAHITGSGIRAATFNPAAVGVSSARRSVPAFTEFDHHHQHGLRTADLLFLGIGSPFGLYNGLFPAYYRPGFGYNPGGFGGYPGYYPEGAYSESYRLDPRSIEPQTPPLQPAPVEANEPLPFAMQGSRDFDMKHYGPAVENWRHALVEDSRNPRLILLLAQGLFQTGQFDEAAGAVQYALTLTPRKQWSEVVPRFGDLYKDNIFDYSAGLRELEKARTQKSEDPALRFLLGYHYSFLGYSEEAIRELDKLQKLAPKDDVARDLREMMEAKRK